MRHLSDTLLALAQISSTRIDWSLIIIREIVGRRTLDRLLLDPHSFRERSDHLIELIKLGLSVILEVHQVFNHLVDSSLLILIHRLQLHVTRSSALQAQLRISLGDASHFKLVVIAGGGRTLNLLAAFVTWHGLCEAIPTLV